MRYILAHPIEVLSVAGEHLFLVVISTGVAVLLGVPLGILLTRRPAWSRWVLGAANLVQTIPSLALFGFLIPLPFLGGIGAGTAITALILYSLLPIIRNTHAGITGIDPAVREAGRGMGMTGRQLLFMVELPLALGVIMTGIRVAAVISVGIATIAAAVGAGGLGMYIFRGVSMVDNQLILAGAIPAAILALLADLVLGAAERALGRTASVPSRTTLIPVVLAVVGGIGVLTAILAGPRDTIVVGSKNFTEQTILGELLAQQIERSTGSAVERRFFLGGTLICHNALVAGEIDMYAEYTGTALTAILGREPISDAREVYRRLRDEYVRRFGVVLTEPLGFNNTFAIMIRKEDARRLQVDTISEAARYAPEWRAGFGHEFMERKDGFRGLAALYGLRFREQPRIMDLGLTYRALAGGQLDLIAGDATNGLIAALDLAVLSDDRGYFPPYEAVPLVRVETLNRHPGLREALAALGGRLSDEIMRRMNYAVDGLHQDTRAVVRSFLEE
jgi:osmoprotectant transport system permease protein